MNRAQRHTGRGRGRSRLVRAAFAAAVGWSSSWTCVPGRADEPKLASPPDAIAREVEVNRGIVDFEQGRFDQALDRLARAEPGRSGPAYYRGLALLALQRAEEALREFESVRGRPHAPAEVELDAGVASLAAGNPAGAELTLARYVNAHPDDPRGHYFLGVAQIRQRRYAEAMVQFDAASADASLAPYRDFYAGMASYARGDVGYRESLGRFGASANPGPAADLARRVAGSSQAAPTPPGVAPSPWAGWGRPAAPPSRADRRWNLAILNGYEYDSNVALVPSITPLGLGGLGQNEDSRYVLAAFADYRLVQRDNLVVGLIGSTYDSFQFRLDEFNLQDYMGGTYANIALGERWILGNRYEFHETLLDGAQFAKDHRLTPNLTFREGRFGHTTAFYEFESIDINGFALSPRQIRSGDINSVGVTQAVYLFEGAGRLFLGYRYDSASTVGGDFDRRTSMINARIEAPLPWKMVGNVEYRQFFDDYLNPNSLDFFGRPRSDTRGEVRVGLQKFFDEHVSLRLDYTYIYNDSNVENLFKSSFYSYDRHVLSTMFVYDF